MRLTFLLLVLVFFVSGAVAQSGRRKQERPQSVPAPTAPAIIDGQPIAAAKISSLIVGGQIIDNYAYYSHSNYMDITLKELTAWLKREPRPFFNVIKGGTVTLDNARERAKRETESHVLWLGIVTRDDGYGQAIVTHINYSILTPTTARVLVSGEIIPGKQSIVGQGGVMTIPSVTKRSSALSQMRQGARQLAERLRSTGWL